MCNCYEFVLRIWFLNLGDLFVCRTHPEDTPPLQSLDLMYEGEVLMTKIDDNHFIRPIGSSLIQASEILLHLDPKKQILSKTIGMSPVTVHLLAIGTLSIRTLKEASEVNQSLCSLAPLVLL